MYGKSNKDAAVRVSHVTAGYRSGSPVIVDLSVDFPEPALVHVQGPNGSGKSTLLELYSGYLKPWAGEVQIGGLDVGSPAARRIRRVCRTQPALFPHMTVHDHLLFASRCVGADPRQSIVRADDYGLGPWINHNAKSLSTGNARKLWYIMCTLGDFHSIFLDEPFNGLDAEGRQRVCAEIEGWARSKSVLLTSHSLPVELRAQHTFALDDVARPPVRV